MRLREVIPAQGLGECICFTFGVCLSSLLRAVPGLRTCAHLTLLAHPFKGMEPFEEMTFK